MKKFIAMLLVLTMALAFAGCAKTEAPAETRAETAPATTAAPETTAAAEAPETTAAPQAGAMTHEEYMAAELDTEVTVETYVQATQSWWDNQITLYCQGPDGAYFAYNVACSEEDAAKLVPGTKVAITGFKAEWDGEIEIMDGTVYILSGADTFVAEPLDATALLGTEELINHQNELVSFTGLTVEAITYKNDEPGDDIYLTLGLDGNSYEFCVEVYLTGTDSEVYTTVGKLNVGDVVNVEGFLYWYRGVNPHITSITVA